jgi:hypothetical protein
MKGEYNFIPGGTFLTARKIFDSDLWRNRPHEWCKIWVYILGHVQFEDYKELKRGEGYFNFRQLSRIQAFGKGVTYPQTDHFLRYAKRAKMLTTRKATHGVIVLVCNYNLYQTFSNYKSESKNEKESDNVSDSDAIEKRNESDNINNNDKNGKNNYKTVTQNGFFSKLPKHITDDSHINYLVEEILKVVNDPHSKKFYSLIASRIPENNIRQVLSEMKADGANNPAKLFTWKMKRFALILKGERSS